MEFVSVWQRINQTGSSVITQSQSSLCRTDILIETPGMEAEVSVSSSSSIADSEPLPPPTKKAAKTFNLVSNIDGTIEKLKVGRFARYIM